MNATLTAFAGLTSRTVAEIVGSPAAVLQYRIENSLMKYGVHFLCPRDGVFYNEAGLALLVEEMAKAGQVEAATRLRTAVKNAKAAAPAPRFGWQEIHQ